MDNCKKRLSSSVLPSPLIPTCGCRVENVAFRSFHAYLEEVWERRNKDISAEFEKVASLCQATDNFTVHS